MFDLFRLAFSLTAPCPWDASQARWASWFSLFAVVQDSAVGPAVFSTCCGTSWLFPVFGYYRPSYRGGMFVCSCLYGHMFSFLWDIYPGVHLLAIAGSCHKCILNFFFKKLPNSFQSGCPILYSCQQCMSVPVPRQHLVLSLFLIFAIIILSKLQISLP